jgi:hypothetical protein
MFGDDEQDISAGRQAELCNDDGIVGKFLDRVKRGFSIRRFLIDESNSGS